MPTSNKDINDMLRQGRDQLSSYHYNGDGVGPPDPKGAIIAVKAGPPSDGAAPSDTGQGLTVLAPGDEDPPDMFVYASGDTPGSMVMYPPGVPCDSGGYRVALDHPATADDLEAMETALDQAQGTTSEQQNTPEETAEAPGGY